MGFIGAIDTSYDKNERALFVGILLVRNCSVRDILSRLKRLGFDLHFRKLGKKQKQMLIKQIDKIIVEYHSDLLLRILIISTRGKLTPDKLSFIERFTSILLKAHRVKLFYTCSDLNRGKYVFSKALENRLTDIEIVEDDSSDYVSLADIFINWYRYTRRSYNFISIKRHYC